MALILAVELYFTSRTQQDVLNELTDISTTINRVTGLQISGEWPKIPRRLSEDAESVRPSARLFESYDSILSLRGEQYKSLLKHLPKLPAVQKFKGNVDIEVEDERIFEDSAGQWRIFKNIRGKRIGVGVQAGDQTDSLAKRTIEEVEVYLKPDRLFKPGSLTVRKIGRSAAWKNKDNEPFTITVPDFSNPGVPRIIRYTYDTAALNSALDEIRNRNIMITLIVFVVSIAAVTYITRRFLKPIGALQNAFTNVVHGDLEVRVKPHGNDEVSELAHSFNLMTDELKKNKEKEQLLQRKERLVSLGQLAAGVAHEVKNPLNALHLTVEHLHDKFIKQSQDPQALRYVESIQTEIRRLDKVVNHFLNYVRSERLELQRIDLQALLQEILQLYGRELSEHRIELKTDWPEQMVCELDRERFKTALVNIILNAIQAMPDGGLLSIQTDKRKNRIVISDTGVGIAEQEMEHMFDMFYTTKSGGTGLGLSTAYKIIKAHGGELTIESRPHQGAVVYIDLPGTNASLTEDTDRTDDNRIDH